MKFTAASIRSATLPAGKSEAIFFDDGVPGFGLRVREGGSRSFVFQYKVGSKQRRIALGSTAALDVGKARDTAKTLYARVRLGEDPAGERAESNAKAAETFETIVALYLARQRNTLRPRSYDNLEHHLLTHAKVLHGLRLAKIERRDIAACITAVANNSGSVTGNRVRTSLSSFFAWAISQGLAEHNPVVGTTRNEEKSRERVLSPDELCTIWNALGTDHFAAVMKLLALTAQRAGEVAGMCWSEINLDECVWSVPKERTKNRRDHVVPLSDAALAIIAAQPHRTGPDGKPRDLIFGAGDGPFSGWSKSRAALDTRIAKTAGKSLPQWTPHDFRRTVSTRMHEDAETGGLGIQPHIVEAVLNHVSGHRAGVAGIYNRALYAAEKRKALDQWAERLLSWVEKRDSKA